MHYRFGVMFLPFQVEPFASLVTLPAGSVPRLLLNRELVGPFKQRGRGRTTDVAVTGDLVESVMSLARGAGWEEELRQLCGYGEEEEEGGGKEGEEEGGGKEGKEEGLKEEKAVEGVGVVEVRQAKEEEGGRWAGWRENGRGGGGEVMRTPGEGHTVSVFTTEPVDGGVRDKESTSCQGVLKTALLQQVDGGSGIFKPAQAEPLASALGLEELVLPLSGLTLEEGSQRGDGGSRRGNGVEEV